MLVHSQDIAVLTDNETLCNRIYSESFNIVPRQICRENFTTGEAKSWSHDNNEQECTANGGEKRKRKRERERDFQVMGSQLWP